MDLQIIFLRELFVTVRAPELGGTQVDHLSVLVQIPFLGEPHITVLALVRLLLRVSPQMVKVLAH